MKIRMELKRGFELRAETPLEETLLGVSDSQEQVEHATGPYLIVSSLLELYATIAYN